MSLRSDSTLMIYASRIAILTALVTAWQVSSTSRQAELFFSSPAEIAATFVDWLADGTLLRHTTVTATEAILGFLIGSFAGIIAGVLLGRSPLIAKILDPFIKAFYSLPKVALAPVFVLWFGIGLEMKVLLAAATVFFLVFTNTLMGVREVSREQILILRLMGANERHVLIKVVLPSAFAWVITGLSLSVPYSLIGAIVAELVASNRGLGFLIANAAGQFHTAGVFAGLIAIVLLAYVMNLGVHLLERTVAPWRARALAQESTT